VLLLLWVNFYTLKNFELISDILETRLENQLDEVAKSLQAWPQWMQVKSRNTNI